MKNVIVLSLVVLIMSIVNANAEVYECSSEAQGKYLIALQDDSGILFRHENGYFQDQNAEVKVARAMDGGPVYIRATSLSGNDWGSAGCFSMKTETHIKIGKTSTIQYLPKFDLNPDQTGCDHRSLPRPMVLPPRPIKCSLK